ncbi:MAG: hypothetical protein QOE11_1691, partial [Solirubrobacteraceae bacterium]|nr:hypothetical protein [Solirubrobacteraceae bacterium]
DTTLSSKVSFAYHALAIDERRGPFKPTLWEQKPDAAGQTLEQVWFSGVHSDVGGGYPDPALAEIPLLWMVANARRRNLVFEPGHFAVQAKATSHESRCKGEQVAPDPLGAIHESRTGPYRLLPSFQRQLADRDGQSASSSARHRLEANIGYESSSLAGWVKAGGRITEVQEGP